MFCFLFSIDFFWKITYTLIRINKEHSESWNDLGNNLIAFNEDTNKIIEDAEKGIELSKGYTNVDEMWKDLEKKDWKIR